MADEEKILKLQEIIDRSERIVFFTGAGVSTESGIPDFRSPDGLYNQKYSVPPETMLSHSYYMSNPREFYKFYRDKMLCLEAEPNKAHRKIYELEKAGKVLGTVTQNIDGLHTKAGCRKVYELHGSVYRNYCRKCGKLYRPEYIKETQGVPKCLCGGIIKPDVVLYEESLNDETVENAVNAIENADCLIVAGTSLTVYPAAGMIRYFKGESIVLINRDKTPVDSAADLVIHDKAGEVLDKIKVNV